jgi:tRNA dimethylallyltransferase
MHLPMAVEKPKIIIIAGPTGAGKTGLAIELARELNAEIVGADSMQIYRHMDIGTAKPTRQEQAAATHHMIDIVDPDEDYDAAAYAEAAGCAIGQIIAHGRLPLVVGGTGFYLKALVYGLIKEGPSDPVVRRRLKQQADAQGGARLHQRLARVDRQAARNIHPNDTFRVIRALEVFEITGETLSAFQQRHQFRQPRFDALTIGLYWPRAVLYDRINRRVDGMMHQGFENEVRWLLAHGYHRHLRSMQSLGYRHLTAYINGESTREHAVDTLKRDHRRYAKRQLTWFNADPTIRWMTPDQPRAAQECIETFMA